MTTSSQSFYLSDLEISITSTIADLGCIDTTPFTGIDAYAVLDVSASVLQSLFQFHSDASDVSDIVTDDLFFRIIHESTETPLSENFLTNTNVYTNAIDENANNNTVIYDYPRYLAKKLFNTFLGVDLFANELEIREGLNTSARTALNTKLVTLASLGELDASSNNNPGFILMEQIKYSVPERLSTIHFSESSETAADGAGAWFYTPILAGDSVYFKLNVIADPDQSAVVDSTIGTIPTRVYQIKMNAVGANIWD